MSEQKEEQTEVKDFDKKKKKGPSKGDSIRDMIKKGKSDTEIIKELNCSSPYVKYIRKNMKK